MPFERKTFTDRKKMLEDRTHKPIHTHIQFIKVLTIFWHWDWTMQSNNSIKARAHIHTHLHIYGAHCSVRLPCITNGNMPHQKLIAFQFSCMLAAVRGSHTQARARNSCSFVFSVHITSSIIVLVLTICHLFSEAHLFGFSNRELWMPLQNLAARLSAFNINRS